MASNSPMSDLRFRFMALMHDHALRRLVLNPAKLLQAAGIQPGQQVLEVGCGPGFFTLPAAELVGDAGCIHAIDLHPQAIEMVERKLQKAGLTNVQAAVADAAQTGLPDASVDLIVLFDVIHSLPMKQVLPEMVRVLRPGGAVAVMPRPRWSPITLTQGGSFAFVGQEGRVFNFRKEVSDERSTL